MAERRSRPRPDVSRHRRQFRNAHERRHPHGQRRQHHVSRLSAQLQIIDVSCPQQMLAIMRWIMDGNRGLVYVRVMRTPSAVIYGRTTRSSSAGPLCSGKRPDDDAVIVSSGRQVHESLVASDRCRERGVSVGVVDMPSIDESLLLRLLGSQKLLVFAEQNDGYLLGQLLKVVVPPSRIARPGRTRSGHGRQLARPRRTPVVHPFGNLRGARGGLQACASAARRDYLRQAGARNSGVRHDETSGCERRRRGSPGPAGPSSQLAHHRRCRRRRALFDVHDPRRARPDGHGRPTAIQTAKRRSTSSRDPVVS